MYSLPIEISKKIFQYLERKDIQTCYYVCKSWYSIAIQLNWEEVKLRCFGIILVRSYLNRFNHCQYFKYGHLVKKLTIEELVHSFFNLENKFRKLELLALLNQLPNITEIDISFTGYKEEYLGFLLEADMQHINKIDIGDLNPSFPDSAIYNLNFLVCYKHRHSISSMYLLYSQSLINFCSQEIDVLNSLTQFKQLTELVFYNKCNANLTLLHVQEHYPNSEYLKFGSHFPISESTMLRLLEKNSKISLNFIASLNRLDLRLPSLLATYTKSIVDYFPNQLAELNIEIMHQTMFNWIDVVSMELALRFMEKAGRINKTYVSFEPIARDYTQANGMTKMTMYFTVLNKFRGTRRTYYTANFCDYCKVKSRDYSFRFNSNDKLFTTYGLYGNNFRGSNSNIDLPDKTSSAIGPEIFDILEFEFWRGQESVLYRALNYSIVNCPGLQRFHMTCNGFQYDTITSSIGYKYEEDQFCSDQTKCAISYLKKEYVSPAQCYLDLVTTRLHDIEILSLTTIDWGLQCDDSYIDLTDFKKLKTFIYTSRSFEIEKNYNNQENILILVKYINGEEQYYYPDEENGKKMQVERGKPQATPCLTLFCDVSVSLYFREGESIED